MTHDKRSYQCEWWTPPVMFSKGGLLSRMVFDLDPCSPGSDNVPWIPAKLSYTREVNGMGRGWRGSVFMNPPYADVAVWVEKFLHHGCRGVTLTACRPETKWGQRLLGEADAVVFPAGRISFVPGAGQGYSSNTVGSMVCAFGVDFAAILDENSGRMALRRRSCK